MSDETALHVDARLITEMVDDLGKIVYEYETHPDHKTTEADLIAWAMLEAAGVELNRLRDALKHKLAETMDRQVTIEGVGVMKRHVDKNRTKWDKDALLSAVRDSRLVDNDGVVKDESPLDKVLAVFNLPAPRTTALAARHIDADQFCEVEERGQTIEWVKP